MAITPPWARMPALQIVSIDRSRLTWRPLRLPVAFTAVDGEVVTFNGYSIQAILTETDSN
jgi:hypothetical protein